MVVTVSRRTLLTLSTAACLLGTFALYELAVSPMVSPGAGLLSEPEVSARGSPFKSSENEKEAEKYLADQTWVTGDKKPFQLRNNGTYVFFRDWQKLEDSGRVRCTAVATSDLHVCCPHEHRKRARDAGASRLSGLDAAATRNR